MGRTLDDAAGPHPGERCARGAPGGPADGRSSGVLNLGSVAADAAGLPLPGSSSRVLAKSQSALLLASAASSSAADSDGKRCSRFMTREEASASVWRRRDPRYSALSTGAADSLHASACAISPLGVSSAVENVRSAHTHARARAIVTRPPQIADMPSTTKAHASRTRPIT